MASIKVPPLGESIVEATVSRWLKQEGDTIAPGDTLVELETDKITVEVPSMTGGVLTKRAHAEGDIVKVDEILAEIDETGSAAGAKPQAAAQPVTAPAQPSTPPASAPPAAPVAAPAGVRASPAAERVAAERGIDLLTV